MTLPATVQYWPYLSFSWRAFESSAQWPVLKKLFILSLEGNNKGIKYLPI